MLSYLWRCYSAAQAILRYFGHLGYRTLGLLSRIFPLFIGDSPFKLEKHDDLEANVPVDIASKNSNCDTYTVRLQPQSDLEIVGVGGSGQVYKVGDQVVLKTCRIFERPGNGASDNARWHYASDTLFHANLLQNERTVLRLLQQRPHPHVIEAVDTDQPEGIYLRKYQPLARPIPAQPQRVRWYRDLTGALCHIHRLGIAHADVRIDNVLFDEQGYAILCDFSAASPLGQPNLVLPDLPLPINGPSPTLSEATDMFAMASLIFQVEHGTKPELFVDSHGTLVLPEIRTGYQSINMIIRNAWLGNYNHTSEMLEHLRSIDANDDRGAHGIRMHSESAELLRDQVRKWRESREKKFGKDFHTYYLFLFLDDQQDF
ncbi:hypothetical protein N7492_002638 [Penicillium capsulatum]|uniref:Protein kinase domain-containing protein n=1 Tax=Penicillium capsulatum TaxID=69766 RepID=A0A9W9IHY1_9EURO|nr:hypothetical protein N7492_002638 [Penicillium capsulatum]KAJ6122761.1 hypothetical protein N7512_005226 [Penicillium capsulatum]